MPSARGPIRAPGLVRLRATYHAYSRPSSITWYVQKIGYLTNSDVDDVAQDFRDWDGRHHFPPAGYCEARGTDSLLVEIRAESCDPAVTAISLKEGIADGGIIGSEIFPLLPTSTAPLMFWDTDPRRPYRGRTYLPGLTTNVYGGLTDLMSVSGAWQAALIGYGMNWVEGMYDLGFIAVLVETQRNNARLTPVLTYPIVQAAMNGEPMGTQRRRSRSGR